MTVLLLVVLNIYQQQRCTNTANTKVRRNRKDRRACAPAPQILEVLEAKPFLTEGPSCMPKGQINPNWHEAGHFPPPCLFFDQILSAEFLSKTFLEVKIDIHRVNLTPYQAL